MLRNEFQLDGGHLLRAMVGKRQKTIAATVPLVLFALAGYVYFVRDSGSNAAYLWAFWGLLTIAVEYGGPASPIQDEALDRKRIGLGIHRRGSCYRRTPDHIRPRRTLAGRV